MTFFVFSVHFIKYDVNLNWLSLHLGVTYNPNVRRKLYSNNTDKCDKFVEKFIVFIMTDKNWSLLLLSVLGIFFLRFLLIEQLSGCGFQTPHIPTLLP